MKLYHCRDSRSLRPLWALEEAGLSYSLVKMPFPPRYRVEGYRSINPLGTVPTLIVGSVVMTESVAMCEYIAHVSAKADLRVNPDESDYPAYLNWLHCSDTTLTFPQTIVLRYSKLETPARCLPQAVDDYRKWFLKRAECVEAALGDADFLCACRFTVADIAVGYALYLATKIDLAADLGPRTLRYLERLCARPGFNRAITLQLDMDPVF